MTAPHPSSQRSVAVVTGAASGIGSALTRSLLARGSTVVAIDLETTSIDERAERVSLDVRDAQAMQRLADRFAGTPVTHVFANAGVGGAAGDVLGLPDAAWQWTWEVNVLGALRTLRLWWPHLCLGRGKAVATLSPAAMTSFPGAGPYRASKAALLAALEGLHYQALFERSGVAVHALCPGMVRSDILNVKRYAEAKADEGEPARPVAASNPFAEHVARAMLNAETAESFAERVLDGLQAGDAPFYWLTHSESRPWIDARHRTIEQSRAPFSDFGAAP